jgi:Protein of unknown function (DUF2800)
MSGAHALVAPSGLHLTMECAFSLLAQLMAPPVEESHEEKEGTAAHWHALQWASGNKIPIGQKFKSGGVEWEVDRDMATGSQMYANEAVLAGASSRFEDPVSVPDIHPQCHGTPDYWRYMPEFKHLKVIEYKYGHRYVDAFENWQLIAYALGVIRRLNIPMDAKVTLVIVQPRCYFKTGNYGQEWVTTVAELFTYVARIVAQVTLALNPNAPARTGKHCMDCKARHLCGTLQRGAMHVVEFTGVGDIVELDNEALGTEARILLEAKELLDARLEGLKVQIEATMRGSDTVPGKSVPYWMMTPGRSLLKWNEGVTVDQIRLLGMAAGGVTTVHPPKPITPTQAKDAGVAEALVMAYATRQPAGLSLKPATTETTRKIFGAP